MYDVLVLSGYGMRLGCFRRAMSVHFNNISWPSLYTPAKEVGFSGPPVRPGGYYLSEPDGPSLPFDTPSNCN